MKKLALLWLLSAPLLAQTPPVSSGPPVTRLSAQERGDLLQQLPGWTLKANPEAIAKTYYFKDFSRAFSFMTRVGLEAQRLDHHPDWSNSWNRVDVTLTTTDIGGLSSRDAQMARIIEEAASDLGARATP